MPIDAGREALRLVRHLWGGGGKAKAKARSIRVSVHRDLAMKQQKLG